jgi:hypothetical protein
MVDIEPRVMIPMVLGESGVESTPMAVRDRHRVVPRRPALRKSVDSVCATTSTRTTSRLLFSIDAIAAVRDDARR